MALHQGIMIACVFAQVGLAIWAIVATGRARIKVLKARELDYDQIALSTDAYPEHIQKLQNNLRNQFELPVLFYAVAALSTALSISNWAMTITSIVYIGSRLIHRAVHVGTNHLPSRFKAYFVGLVAICLLWLFLGIDLLFAV